MAVLPRFDSRLTAGISLLGNSEALIHSLDRNRELILHVINMQLQYLHVQKRRFQRRSSETGEIACPRHASRDKSFWTIDKAKHSRTLPAIQSNRSTLCSSFLATQIVSDGWRNLRYTTICAPLAGVVRELESEASIDRFLSCAQVRRNNRFRQAIGVLVRMIMERRGWRKTGRKGSLGVRAAGVPRTPAHNTGGLAFWFCRAERYEPADGVPYVTVQNRCRELESSGTQATRPGRQSTGRKA